MKFPDHLITPDMRRIFDLLGHESVRMVGGCIRNALMGIPVGDIDFATTLPPKDVVEIFSKHGLKTVPTGIGHGTVTVVLSGKGYEITTLRRDVATDGRRAVVAYTDDWAEDAARRDFTVNALYADVSGQIFDPLGRGLADLEKRKIIFVGDPDQRIKEDYLRILRFFRFHTSYGRGRPDPDALAAMTRHAAGMRALSRERVTQEFLKILFHPDGYKTFRLMADHHIFKYVLPFRIEDATLKKLVTLQAVSERDHPDFVLAARLYVLIAYTPAKREKLRAALILKNKQKDLLDHLAKNLPKTLTAQKLQEYLYRSPRPVVESCLDVLAAKTDMLTVTYKKWVRVLDGLDVPVFPVTGQDLIKVGMTEGPEMGVTLKKLESKWIKSGFELSKGELLRKF